MKRTFDTGATRDTEEGKLDYEGALSPLVLQRYVQYLHKHRKMADGSIRDSDNWQKGVPLDSYMKSAWRHFMDVWAIHRQRPEAEVAFQDALCGLLFNVMGYLHEVLKSTDLSQDKSYNFIIALKEVDANLKVQDKYFKERMEPEDEPPLPGLEPQDKLKT
ncbi:hypothetical protein LCGC14_0903510 [marine sediment metagenome]|uniref:dATP/dGTP diphosphohydrolase N-terminal domain-containing protein n=1 Tax=marine sediment metagenome TaxID=412755 RepID=A0A0F9PGE8_9ZZZZ